MWCVPALSRGTKTNKLVWRVANTPPSTFHLPFVLYQKGGWMTSQLLLFYFFYLSRSLSRSLSLSLLWLRTGDCPLAMEWWEIGGDALAGLEEEVVEEELLVERSRPPPPPPLPVPLLLCLMPLSSMPWPLPPVTSFHNCWSSAGLRPARETERVGERKTKARWGEWRLGRYNCSPKCKPQCLVWDKSWSLNSIQQQEKLREAAWLKAFPSVWLSSCAASLQTWAWTHTALINKNTRVLLLCPVRYWLQPVTDHSCTPQSQRFFCFQWGIIKHWLQGMFHLRKTSFVHCFVFSLATNEAKCTPLISFYHLPACCLRSPPFWW